MMKRVACAVFCAWAVGAGAETLTWNGTDGDAWGGAAQNWMDESGRACAWKNGAEAVFAQVLRDLEYHIVSEKGIEYRCYCSRERVEEAVRSIGPGELDEIIAKARTEEEA